MNFMKNTRQKEKETGNPSETDNRYCKMKVRKPHENRRKIINRQTRMNLDVPLICFASQ